ncbi:hypothetical protein JM83_1555 [Gillisia sp. Hel_I_86]|uniref:hypothetical protein n=1 Tax=Gillisia sp. Hel_I_86 TaxID=1249981 RepID=UPI00119C3913|nr:hypothetical protein [Gillisia sp. Hel_I_86]TVZ26580.1 hypothetical protein JM83_1555 [Gillisia sp. Hel_I_86]
MRQIIVLLVLSFISLKGNSQENQKNSFEIKTIYQTKKVQKNIDVKKVAIVKNKTLFIVGLNSDFELISIETNNPYIQMKDQGYGQCVKNCKTGGESPCKDYEGWSEVFCMAGCYIDCGIDSNTYTVNKIAGSIDISIYENDSSSDNDGKLDKKLIKNKKLNKSNMKIKEKN